LGTLDIAETSMDLVGLQILLVFAQKHADVSSRISTLTYEIQEAQWEKPGDIKVSFPSASFLAENRVIFNLKGNKYRVDTKISYPNKVVYVIRAGTHAEYTKWKF
jgi:mRNA interferase HigB